MAEQWLVDPELQVVVGEEGALAGATVERLAERWNEMSSPARSHYELLGRGVYYGAGRSEAA